MMYKIHIKDILKIHFSARTPITEKVVRWYLATNGVDLNHLRSLKKINDCPFNENNKHKVDFMLTNNARDEELYIEVKGQMTYTEVNKLRFLLEYSGKNFYILQLTEHDWIVDNRPNAKKSKTKMSKNAFEKQFKELLEFYEGKIEAQEMSQISKERLNQFIANRNKEYQSWVALKKQREQLANDNHETT